MHTDPQRKVGIVAEWIPLCQASISGFQCRMLLERTRNLLYAVRQHQKNNSATASKQVWDFSTAEFGLEKEQQVVFIRELWLQLFIFFMAGLLVQQSTCMWLSLLNVEFLMFHSCIVCSVGFLDEMKRWQREDSPRDVSVPHQSLQKQLSLLTWCPVLTAEI